MFLTIITPTYNRASTLPKLYKSLKNQSNKEFKWIIVDDGSTDNTKDLVHNYIRERELKIEYVKKINEGKHSAVNVGIERTKSELSFIVDSDDYLELNAVEIIKRIWMKYSNDKKIGSFWFLQKSNSGEVLGDKFPQDEFISNYITVLINSSIKGDKKSVYRTELRKKNPFPVFKEEKFLGEGLVHKWISNNHNSVFVNEAIYVSEYLDGGLTNAGREMRLKNPLGGMEISKTFLSKDIKKNIRIKKLILYMIYAICAKKQKKDIIKESNMPITASFLFPVSYLLYLKWIKS